MPTPLPPGWPSSTSSSPPPGWRSWATTTPPRCTFKDPFNDVQGVPAIRAIFAHMFESLEQPPAQCVTQHVAQGQQAFLQWEFHFRMKRWHAQVPQCIHGGTLVHFDAQGRVTLHRDYWDTVEELYEKLPVLGRLMRWLRQSKAPPLYLPHLHHHADLAPP